LGGLFALDGPGPHVLAIEMRLADGGRLPVVAVATRLEDPEHGPCLRTVKWTRGGALDDVARLAEEKEILSSILAASDDAGWCMEWAEPVDLSAPERETIRQVFENGPRWRFCNDAMARLYRTPVGEDFNGRPVHETFPRTPENEDFVRRLIRANFDLNASPSRDLRYDGLSIEVENDVRGHIRGNLLYRMWGTVRDVSKHARRAAVLRDEIETLEAMLRALPDALVVADRDGQILRANIAAEDLLDLTEDVIRGRGLTDLVDLPMGLAALFEMAEDHVPGHFGRIMPVALKTMGRVSRADMTIRHLALRDMDCLMVSLRARLGSASSGDTWGPRSRTGVGG
jgi:PAS domain-containing protein